MTAKTSPCETPSPGAAFHASSTPRPRSWEPRSEDCVDELNAPARRRGWQRLLCDYRVAEFGSTLAMYFVAKVFSWMVVKERPIPRVQVRFNPTMTIWARDPSVDQIKMAEQVPMWALIVFGISIPVVVNLVLNYVAPKIRDIRVIPHDVRDFLLTLVQAMTLSTLLTQFTKHVTGRYRPCFYDMCGWDYDAVWDGVTNLCTDKAGEEEGRKSFPSGHASFAWATMLVLTLYLLGRSRLTCSYRSESFVRGGSKALKLFLCFAPCLAASWVAITRSIDNWHHYGDILAGSIIGAISACLAYNYNYSSVFSQHFAGLPCEAVYEKLNTESLRPTPQCEYINEAREKTRPSQTEYAINMANHSENTGMNDQTINLR